MPLCRTFRLFESVLFFTSENACRLCRSAAEKASAGFRGKTLGTFELSRGIFREPLASRRDSILSVLNGERREESEQLFSRLRGERSSPLHVGRLFPVGL